MNSIELAKAHAEIADLQARLRAVVEALAAIRDERAPEHDRVWAFAIVENERVRSEMKPTAPPGLPAPSD